jgi:hypothetical protein
MMLLGCGENDVASQFGIERHGAGDAQLWYLTNYQNEKWKLWFSRAFSSFRVIVDEEVKNPSH